MAEALATKNALVKKQVVDLLSAVCVYSPKGHAAAVDALDYLRGGRIGAVHRCAVLVAELGLAEATVEYKTAVLSLVNCLVLANPEPRWRHSIRSELIGPYLKNTFYCLSCLRSTEMQPQTLCLV